MKNVRHGLPLLFLAAFLTGCQTTAPSADCAFWDEPPLTDNDINMISSPLARWLDEKTSAADRICKQ